MKIAVIIIASLAVAAVAMPKKEHVADDSEKALEDKPLMKDAAASKVEKAASLERDDKTGKDDKLEKIAKPEKDYAQPQPEDKPSKGSAEPDSYNGKVGPVTTVDNDFSGSRVVRGVRVLSADLENQRFTVRTSSGNIVHLANTQ